MKDFYILLDGISEQFLLLKAQTLKSETCSVILTICQAFITLGGIHASHGEHGSHGGLPRPRAGTLKQWAPLRQQVILHSLHQQPLALHAVPEQRVGLQIGQELHNTETERHAHSGTR